MAYFTAAGTIVSVCATLPDTYDEAGYGALSFTDVGELTSVPDFGPAAALVTHNPLATRITGKVKGSLNYGSTSLQMALDDDDAGQDILRDFAYGDNIDDDCVFKITFSSGAIRYFTAQVMSFVENAQQTDAILGATAQIEITRPVVKVAAS